MDSHPQVWSSQCFQHCLNNSIGLCVRWFTRPIKSYEHSNSCIWAFQITCNVKQDLSSLLKLPAGRQLQKKGIQKQSSLPFSNPRSSKTLSSMGKHHCHYPLNYMSIHCRTQCTIRAPSRERPQNSETHGQPRGSIFLNSGLWRGCGEKPYFIIGCYWTSCLDGEEKGNWKVSWNRRVLSQWIPNAKFRK